MKQGKLWRLVALTAAALGFAGCGVDRAAGPSADKMMPESAAAGLLSELLDIPVSKDILTRKVALAQDITVAATIGKSGGTLSIPEAGFTLIVPPGAVGAPVEFSVTAIAGRSVAYEFAPHGIAFNVPLVARQDLRVTDYRLFSFLGAAYFADRSVLDLDTATGLVSELINGLTLPLTKQFYWPIRHFSGYIVTW
jgi:hypothetical protein